jgi:hypothetical protein
LCEYQLKDLTNFMETLGKIAGALIVVVVIWMAATAGRDAIWEDKKRLAFYTQCLRDQTEGVTESDDQVAFYEWAEFACEAATASVFAK